MRRNWRLALGIVATLAVTLWAYRASTAVRSVVPEERREVVFWHFWGGAERAIVEDVVARFNASQDLHFVRAVAMPGHNLDLKFFLSVTGGDPPDLMNHDDPVIADWAHRGAIVPVETLTDAATAERLASWLSPAARSLATYDGKLVAVPNGLDVRALYYDVAALEAVGASAPRTIGELDALARELTDGENDPPKRYGYLPDPRRLWAWGIVYGGGFYDRELDEVTIDDAGVVEALEWMCGYANTYGADRVAAFRKGDQALTGSSFPLVEGRYAMLMDGQWRVLEMAEVNRAREAAGEATFRYGVVPLPAAEGGRENAGWVNGNFFVVPRGAKNPEGAWAFAKFWSGFDGNEAEAAATCAAGGWIPASGEVVREPAFQEFLNVHPEFATFVELSQSANQVPTPTIVGASLLYNEVIRAAEDAMYRGVRPVEALEAADARVRARIEEARGEK